TGTYYYFGGRMVKNASAWVYGDRLGSIGKYYPYGQERPSATQYGTEKFTGYLRDAETGLDYADQRYEQPGLGRFLTPDRVMGTPADPGSWNLYAYTCGDPVNRIDRSGMDDCDPENPQDCYCQIYGASDPHCDPNYCPAGICGGGTGTGNGLPSCSDYAKENGLTQTQLFDFLVITQDASRLGLDLSGFSATFPAGMQIAGGQGPSPGIPADQTELVLTGTPAALAVLEQSMCGLQSGYNASTPNCFANGGFDLLHGGTPGNQINFRQDTPTNSMQITGSFSQATGLWTINVDIDPNNPMAFPGGAIRHAGNVLRNSFTGRDTDYSKVANGLGINAYKNNGYCNP
ncbi:MAG TPA: RHS repeat-associated core domain-containing protein, partial [Gemmataceae bacterium]|nr:RHS repeat-associated core domain-containing protein [Gemmataceae bacterium]